MKTVQKTPAAGETLVDLLITTSFVTTALMGRLGARHGLSLTTVRLLGILWDRRPRMSDLADHLGLEKQTLSGLIARAEQRGLVTRAPDPDDRRATNVVLTPAGVKVVEQLRAEGIRDLAPLLESLSAADRRTLQTLLKRLVAGARSTGPNETPLARRRASSVAQ
jgi:DNA-binding MarR family transcriptional regulator